jgi:F-type H+-transporting ATPase subunit b
VLIDWVTVGAQVVNFVVLAVALRFLLYGRVVAAMDARQERIASREREAEGARAEAVTEADRLRRANEELGDRRHELLEDARRDADAYREELARQARAEVETKRGRWLRSLEGDRDRILRDLTTRVGEEVVDVTERALADLVGAELEAQAVGAFVRQLDDLDPRTREALIDSLSAADAPHRPPPGTGTRRRAVVVVHTTFDLPEELRRQVERALDARSRELDLRFTRDPHLICGIELRARGRSVGWNVAAYLDALRRDLGEILDQEVAAGEDDREAAGA